MRAEFSEEDLTKSSLAIHLSDSYEPRCLTAPYSDRKYLVSIATQLAIARNQSHALSVFPNFSKRPPNIAATMETQPTQKPIAVILGPGNWTEWIRSIQRRAETLGVWKYVDPNGDEELQDPKYPEPKDVNTEATKYSALDDDEKEELKELRAQY